MEIDERVDSVSGSGEPCCLRLHEIADGYHAGIERFLRHVEYLVGILEVEVCEDYILLCFHQFLTCLRNLKRKELTALFHFQFGHACLVFCRFEATDILGMSDGNVYHYAHVPRAAVAEIAAEAVLRVGVGVEVVGLGHDVGLQPGCGQTDVAVGHFLRFLKELHLITVVDRHFSAEQIRIGNIRFGSIHRMNVGIERKTDYLAQGHLGKNKPVVGLKPFDFRFSEFGCHVEQVGLRSEAFSLQFAHVAFEFLQKVVILVGELLLLLNVDYPPVGFVGFDNDVGAQAFGCQFRHFLGRGSELVHLVQPSAHVDRLGDSHLGDHDVGHVDGKPVV